MCQQRVSCAIEKTEIVQKLVNLEKKFEFGQFDETATNGCLSFMKTHLIGCGNDKMRSLSQILPLESHVMLLQ